MELKIRNIAMIGLIAGSLSFYACGENRKENQVSTPMQNEMHQEKTGTNKMEDEKMMASSAEFKEEAVATSYKNYIMVKDALVATDVQAAQKHAQKLVDNGNAEISNAAKKIANSKDVNMQREAFSELTIAMELVLDEALKSGEIYKQFCPMAFEGKGDYWYSNSKEIRNPYFGDKMLKCGRVEATIQ